MTKLQLAEGLSLPLEIVTERSAFIGRTGQGKSYAAQKLAELLYAAGAQFIVLDPVGVWWGLRLAANGKDPGLKDLPVLGGLHGDLPLESTAGKVIADLAVDEGRSMVLDVSGFEHDTDRTRFAQHFAERFFHRKKSQPSAVLLMLEEAQEFVPQNPGPKETDMLHALTRLAKIGRNFGIGVCSISQRPQEVNKKVLNLTELLFAFQLNGTHERKAVEAWIQDKAIDEDIGAELPKLKPWHPHAWSPSWLGVSKVVRILPKWTFDASSTPKAGSKVGTFRPLGPIDKEKLEKAMAATVEKAKAEDPKELRRTIAEKDERIRELERQPATRVQTSARVEEKRVEVPVLKEGQLKRAETIILRHHEAVRENLAQEQELERVRRDRWVASQQKVFEAIHELTMAIAKVGGNGHRPPLPGIANPRGLASRSASATTRPVPVSSSTGSRGNENRTADAGLPKGERAILIATAQHDGADRKQLTILTGYKRSTRDAYIQRLTEKGYVAVQGDRILPTEAGTDALGSDFEPLPVGDALREHWMARLPEGERKCLAVVAASYPNPVDRELISEGTGYKRSTRDAYLQRLGSRKLVADAGRGQVMASEELFG